MSACPGAEQLRHLLNDQLSPLVEQAILAHIDTCPGCQQALEALTRMEHWLQTPGERELTAGDREIVQPLLARLGDKAGLVAELVLGPAMAPEGKIG